MTTSAAPDNSEIRVADHSTTVTGKDGMLFYAAITLRQAIKMHVRSGGRMRMTAAAKPTVLLKTAEGYTKKKYKRGQYQEALDDLTNWIETMRAGLPFTDERTEVPKE